MKLIIAGSRTIRDAERLEESLERLLSSLDWLPTEIVCGMAEGPDLIGKAWAEKLGFPVKEFYPNWKTHGSYAGHLRNEDMGNYADALVAFWDGRSTGTRHMIEYMKKLGKPHRVIVGFRQPFI